MHSEKHGEESGQQGENLDPNRFQAPSNGNRGSASFHCHNDMTGVNPGAE